MEKKNILYLVNSKIYSGLENVAITLIEELKETYNIVYVTQDGPIVDTLKDREIPYEIISSMSKKEINRVIEKYDPYLIHAHDYKASCIAALSGTKVRIISHLHNNSPWIKSYFHPFTYLYLFCSRKFSDILIVSDSIEKEYVFSKYIYKKIKNVGNPISRKKILEKITNINEKKVYDVCTVGRLTEQKNPLLFIDIISELKKEMPNIKAVMVGDGELKDKCINKINELQLNENIDMVGFQKNPFDYMNKSKVFCLPSSWEGFGLVAFEALTLGLPCIVSNVGGLPGIVDDSCGSLCNNKNEFIEKINKALNQGYDLEKSISKAKEIDSIQEYKDNLINIYK